MKKVMGISIAQNVQKKTDTLQSQAVRSTNDVIKIGLIHPQYNDVINDEHCEINSLGQKMADTFGRRVKFEYFGTVVKLFDPR